MVGSVERVTAHVRDIGLDVQFRSFDVSTKSSALAAQALGCTVAEIAKSVVFRGKRAVVVVISGDRRVDQSRLSAVEGSPVAMATPSEVRGMTGYPIGGVPPFPHAPEVGVLVDSSVTRFDSVWAAGGAPNAVFRLKSKDLLRILGGSPVQVSEGQP